PRRVRDQQGRGHEAAVLLARRRLSRRLQRTLGEGRPDERRADDRAGGAAGPGGSAGRGRAGLARRAAPKHALVPDPPGEPVGVEALEQQLGVPPPTADQIAEARERDPADSLALLDESAPRLLVAKRRDGQSVADPD